MRNRLVALLVAVIALALPAVASAHTGSVTATCTTVVFSYNANFANATTSTETYTVAGVTKTRTVVVPAYHTLVDTITITPPSAAFVTTAGATWKDGQLAGSIATSSFGLSNCKPPTPPSCPAGTTRDASSTSTVLVCDTPPATPTCPDGTTEVSRAAGAVVCGTTTTVTVDSIVTKYVDRWHPGKVLHKTKVITKRVLIPWCAQHLHRKTAGTTG